MVAKNLWMSACGVVLISQLAAPAFSQLNEAQKRRHELQVYRVNATFSSKLPLAPRAGPKSIYGEDNRKDVVNLPANDDMREFARSTCLLTFRSNVNPQADRLELALFDYKYEGDECCAGEPFRDQKRAGWCSGFLVAPDIVVTAGHCCKDDVNVQEIAFVFGFSVDAAGSTPSTFLSNQIYFGSQLLKRQVSDSGDFAVIRLDRAVAPTVAKPLSVASVAPNAGADIILIGYPFGLPCKVADGAKVLDQVSGGRWLRTNCDAYGGNSGSAVVDENGVVIGILVRGNTDFRIKTNNGVNCFESIRYLDTDGTEVLTRCEVFRGAIPGIQ